MYHSSQPRKSPVSVLSCNFYPFKGGLGVTNVKTRCHTLHPIFLGWMWAQHDENSKFWKEDAKKTFPNLRSMHSNYCQEAITQLPGAVEYTDCFSAEG